MLVILGNKMSGGLALSYYFHNVESESESRSVVPNSWQPHRLSSPWNSPGQNTGVGSPSLLWGIFPAQGLNPGLPHCWWILFFFFFICVFPNALFKKKKKYFFNWRIIALQNFVFCQTLTWISHRYTYIPSLLNVPSISLPSHPSRLIQSTYLSFLRHTENSCCLSILHMVM